jgi:hypothetical protein
MRIRSPRALRPPLLRLIPVLLLAACDGGEAAAVPQLHELRLSIVQGRGMVDTVRTPGIRADSVQLVARPVVARVYAVLDEEAGTPITEPGREVDLPPVTIRWRTLQSWCDPLAATSTAGADGTASNQVHRPIHALPCRLVAEGLVDGQVFDADTATILFKPGPAAAFTMPPVIGHLLGSGVAFYRAVSFPQDVYGNYVEEFTATGQLLSGSPPFELQDTLVISPVEATATLRVTVGQTSRDVTVWALADLRGFWRLEWACHGLPPADAGGAHTDSVHYRLDAEMHGGGLTGRGLVVRLEGALITRTWPSGEPMRETTATGQVRFAAQRPAEVEWSPGQVAVPAGDGGYAGGSLCEPLADGRAWARFTPARMIRR